MYVFIQTIIHDVVCYIMWKEIKNSFELNLRHLFQLVCIEQLKKAYTIEETRKRNANFPNLSLSHPEFYYISWYQLAFYDAPPKLWATFFNLTFCCLAGSEREREREHKTDASFFLIIEILNKKTLRGGNFLVIHHWFSDLSRIFNFYKFSI